MTTSTSSNPKAQKEEQLGDKLVNKWDWFGLSKQNNQEDAADHFVKAAALYKISKDFEDAGRCYEKAAKANLAAGNEIEAVGNYKDAGKMYIHCNPKKAMEMYKHAIQFYLESNKFSQAAKLQEQIGDMLLEENNIEEAINAYEECADLFKTENELNQMNKRLLKVAHLSAKLGRYPRCIQIFESVANHNVDNNLLRWNVKTLLFKGMICQINNYIAKNKQDDNDNNDDDNKENTNNDDGEKPTIETLEETFKTYCDLSDIFASSKEAKLIDSILKAMPNNDMDSFKQAIYQYDKIIKLEAWCTEQLLIVERFMSGQLTASPDLLSDDNNNNYNNNNNNNKKDTKEQTGGMNPFDFDRDDGPDLNNAPNLDDAPEL